MNIREWTLPLYSILTQLAIGTIFVLWVIRTLGVQKYGQEEMDRIFKIPVLIIFVTLIVGIAGAHFHLSKPLLSFLALRNFHSSWLSREIVFDLLFITSVGTLGALLWFGEGHGREKTIMGWAAILFGFATDFCMSRIYMLPSQPAWDSPLTPISFLCTTLLLGVMSAPVLLIMDASFSRSLPQENQEIRQQVIKWSVIWLAVGALVMAISVVIIAWFQLSALRTGNQSAQASVELLLGLYQPLQVTRYALLFIGAGGLVFAAVLLHNLKKDTEKLMMPVFTACLLVMIAEILGRFLFFAIHVRIGI